MNTTEARELTPTEFDEILNNTVALPIPDISHIDGTTMYHLSITAIQSGEYMLWEADASSGLTPTAYPTVEAALAAFRDASEFILDDLADLADDLGPYEDETAAERLAHLLSIRTGLDESLCALAIEVESAHGAVKALSTLTDGTLDPAIVSGWELLQALNTDN